MELNIQNTFKLFTLLFHRQLFSSNSHWSAFVISLNQSITRLISFHKKSKIRPYPEITSLLSPDSCRIWVKREHFRCIAHEIPPPILKYTYVTNTPLGFLSVGWGAFM
jgi:hypothetical protein